MQASQQSGHPEGLVVNLAWNLSREDLSQEKPAMMTDQVQANLEVAQPVSLNRERLVEAYAQHNGELFRYAFRFLGDASLAEDCVSETYCRLLKAIRDGLGPVENLRAYLYRVAHNWITDYYRSQPGKLITLEVELQGEPEANPSMLVGELLEREQVRAALMQLLPDQQQVLMLRFVEDLSHEEVAAIMGRSIQATRTLQHRALLSLKKYLTLGESGFSYTRPIQPEMPPVPAPSRSSQQADRPVRRRNHGWSSTRAAQGD